MGAGDTEDHGIIPARAGFTTAASMRFRLDGDHPRSRGVYRPNCQQVPAVQGSSPLARGLLESNTRRSSPSRIIPARAGFTDSAFLGAVAAQDHPRSRGVYSPLLLIASSARGSSPLARGLRTQAIRVAAVLGIIPARAGFTIGHGPGGRFDWDHPRSRGVYSHVAHVSYH